MAPKASGHINGEDIDRYSMGNTSEAETAQFEEHLLICGICRERVSQTDEFVGAMGRASAKLREEESAAKRSWWTPRRLTWMLAAAAALAVLMVAFSWGSRKPEFAVNLAAMRGSELMAQVPAGAPLVLNPDLTGLAPAESYDLEVVDAVGRKVWRGTFPGHPVTPLHRGTYFARLYSGGELLREFGLVAK